MYASWVIVVDVLVTIVIDAVVATFASAVVFSNLVTVHNTAQYLPRSAQAFVTAETAVVA